MAIDVFNNPSNDYVNPGLSPCVNVPDGNKGEFKFTDGGAGVIAGSDILQFMDLSGISIDVTEWSGKKQTLQSGEVIYIPGTDKGLLNKRQVFNIPEFGETNQKYYFIIDLSIGYYNNFRYYNINLDASSNYSLNLDIDNALNIALSDNNIRTEATYNTDNFTFLGSQLGYEYDISNVVLTIIDASMDSTSPFPAIIVDGERVPQTYNLVEDVSLALPGSKYPNGAMLGYILKANYPTDECYRDYWLYMNHVKSPFDVCLPVDLITNIEDISTYTVTTFDPSVQWGPFVDDVSIDIKDVSCVDTGYTYDPSYGDTIINEDVSNAIIDSSLFTFSTITNSIIIRSGIVDFELVDENYISDSSIYSSDLYDSTGSDLSFVTDSFISDSSLSAIDVSGGFLQKSYVRLSLLENLDVACLYLLEDTSVFNSTVRNLVSDDNDFYSSGIANTILNNGGVYDSSVLDVSIISSTISGTYVQDSDVSSGNILNSYLENTVIFKSYIEDSSVSLSPIQGDTSIFSSTLQNTWLNAYIVTPGLWADDVSPSIIEIHESTILDTSIYNATVYDSIIYTSHIYDSSLIRCSIYNSEIDDTVTIDVDSSTIKVDAVCDASVSWNEDVSTYYEKIAKAIDVGMSGSGNATTLSAADYLDYINTNDLWFKVGKFASRFTAPDIPESNQKNLIGGFYLFNPQQFPINIEYMILNKVES